MGSLAGLAHVANQHQPRQKRSAVNHVLMMLTAKNTLPAESPSGAELAFFLIFMKYQRKIKEKGLTPVSAAALTTPPGGCRLKRVGGVDGCSSSPSPSFTRCVCHQSLTQVL